MLQTALRNTFTFALFVDSPLKTVSVDLPAKNRENHHTTEYEGDGVILRRGQEFEIMLEFDREFDEEKDNIRLTFETGLRCFSVDLFIIIFVR